MKFQQALLRCRRGFTSATDSPRCRPVVLSVISMLLTVFGLICAVSVGAAELFAPDPAVRGKEIRAKSPKPQAWRYARVGNLEVISTASDSKTADMLDDFVLQNRALDFFWPVVRENEQTAALIVCNRQEDYVLTSPPLPPPGRGRGNSAGGLALGGRGGQIRGVLNLEVQGRVQSVPVTQIGGTSRSVRNAASTGVPTSTPNILVPPTNIGTGPSDRIIEQLRLRVLSFERGGLTAPSWLMESSRQLVSEMSASRSSVSFPALTTDKTFAARKAGSEADLQKALADETFFPLERLFAGSSLAGSEMAINECYEFEHLCLFGAGGKYREAFIKFASDLNSGVTVDAAGFKERFGLDYQGMLLEVWKYTALSKKMTYKLETKDGKAIAPVEKMTFRDATDEDLGRLVDPNQASPSAPGF